jgi:hypothetical protein
MKSNTAEDRSSQDSGRRRGGDLEIIEERVMLAIPRGDEELRVTFTRARTGDGKEVAWHSIRVFWRTDNGEWRPGKQGITIRGKELRAVIDALMKACTGVPAFAATSANTTPRSQRPTSETEQRAPQRSPSAEGGDDDIPF